MVRNFLHRPALVQSDGQYLPKQEPDFLDVKSHVAHVPHWKAALYTHVFSGMCALCAMLTQFFRSRRPWTIAMHRLMGRMYAVVVLVIAAPSGAILAWYAEGGISGRLGFGTLVALWALTTAEGVRAARARDYALHRAWMIRSFALTLSAVTVREWQFWLGIYLPPHVDINSITAWMGWLPNLLIAECWLRWSVEARISDRQEVPIP